MFLNCSWCELKLLTSDPYGKGPVIMLGEVSSSKDAPVPVGALVIQHFMRAQNFLSS